MTTIQRKAWEVKRPFGFHSNYSPPLGNPGQSWSLSVFAYKPGTEPALGTWETLHSQPHPASPQTGLGAADPLLSSFLAEPRPGLNPHPPSILSFILTQELGPQVWGSGHLNSLPAPPRAHAATLLALIWEPVLLPGKIKADACFVFSHDIWLQQVGV